MPFFDYSQDQLAAYLPTRTEPADFDEFWERTLAETRSFPLDVKLERVDYGLQNIESYDVTYRGFGGQLIKGWLNLPAHRSGKIPAVVEFIGYGGGRSFPTDWLLWASAGYAHLIMDTRGQGSNWSTGDTPDPEPENSNPHTPGFMTRGILNPNAYYYRRVYTDGVRAVEAAQQIDQIDPERVAVTGGSQGGGISIAVAGLTGKSGAVKIAMPDVPFLCHFRRATEIVETLPYGEISKYCNIHRNQVEQVFSTLNYFDGVNLGTRATAKALFSVGLMDDICPPSTVYAAYNYYGGEKSITVWPYNKHEGGGQFQNVEKVRFLRSIW